METSPETSPSTTSIARFRALPGRSLIIIGVLLAIALFSLPRYLGGQIAWRTPAEIANVAPMRTLRDQGLAVPNWDTVEQGVVPVGSHKWSLQLLQPPADQPGIQTNKPTYLMLRSQDWHDKEPQVDWVDLNGFLARSFPGPEDEPTWITDQRQFVDFTVTVSDPQDAAQTHTVPIRARYLRGRNTVQTYALLQWYTWPTAGTPSATDWFWADQRSRLRTGDRAAWVAVGILVPIPPFADIDQPETLATMLALAQTVETELLTTTILPAMMPTAAGQSQPSSNE